MHKVNTLSVFTLYCKYKALVYIALACNHAPNTFRRRRSTVFLETCLKRAAFSSRFVIICHRHHPRPLERDSLPLDVPLNLVVSSRLFFLLSHLFLHVEAPLAHQGPKLFTGHVSHVHLKRGAVFISCFTEQFWCRARAVS
jgi:hypothetical protein